MNSKLARILRSAMAMAAIGGMTAAHAATDYPQRPVTIVVQQSAGSTGDLIARALADALTKRWQQPIVVENKPGANGMIATSQVVRSRPDGYTLLMSGSTPLAFNPLLYKDVPYDLRKDFTYLAPAVEVPFVVLASPKLGVTQFQAFVDKARKSPGALTFSSGGVGNSTHLVMEMVMAETGTDLLHVPFTGVSPALASTMAGDTDLMVSVLSSALGQIQAGKVVPLAVSTSTRAAEIPDVPTFAELGIQGLPTPGWLVLVGPAGIPEAVASKINADVQAVLRDDDMVRKLRGYYAVPMPAAAQVARDRFLLEHQVWGEFISKRNIVAQ